MHKTIKHSKGPLEQSKVLEWCGQMCAALRAIHDEHIIHRDVKPDNIFICHDGLRLGDFGLAKYLPHGDTNIHAGTANLSIAGSILYVQQFV